MIPRRYVHLVPVKSNKIFFFFNKNNEQKRMNMFLHCSHLKAALILYISNKIQGRIDKNNLQSHCSINRQIFALITRFHKYYIKTG